ncbi:MAG: Bacillosamine/Legionaminic acid biosynthesis aminotransferase PglE [Acidobacteriaceae bacterium]|nr:Bacillosamine/Legionaminic acid biosynthesis aminotransferase PglE [Acidobacteriaceae bacterium]
MKVRIPLAQPEITEADRDAVLNVLGTPYLSMGPKLAEFEQAICDYTGCKYAVAVNSGTSALHVAVRALGLERGAEVILPSFTFSALLNVILQEGLRPKFVDIDPETYNITPGLVAAAITPQTRLILAVHTFGFPVDVKSIGEVAKEYGISQARPHSTSFRAGPHHTAHIIEDACEALGAEVGGRKAGSIGDAGLFAFYPNKQITTGEGGVLITSDKGLAEHARRLRNQGRDPELDWLQHVEVGFSYRISDINCALGVSQLQRIENVIEGRQKLAEIYDREVPRMDEIHRPPITSEVGRISWFVYPIRLGKDFSRANRDWICESMLRKGIATGRYFAPLHLQPVLASPIGQAKSGLRLPQTEFVADRIIALPFFNELTEKQIQEVCGALEESVRELRRKT